MFPALAARFVASHTEIAGLALMIVGESKLIATLKTIIFTCTIPKRRVNLFPVDHLSPLARVID